MSDFIWCYLSILHIFHAEGIPGAPLSLATAYLCTIDVLRPARYGCITGKLISQVRSYHREIGSATAVLRETFTPVLQ